MNAARGDTPRRILEAAFDVFSEKGYHPATMDEIAERAGVSKAALYLYHPSKQALFMTILQGRLDQFRMLIDGAGLTAFDGTADDARAVAYEVVARALAPVQNDRSWLPLYMEYLTTALRGDAEARAGLRALYAELRGRARGLLSALQERGLVRSDLDPDASAGAVIATFEGLVLQACIDPEAFPFERLVGLLTGLIIDWLIPRE
ncbi:MAG TPA: TetR/AcrR family transcriptional regulator [Bacillota bacterium]